jgi:hypothetical protein
VAKASALSLHKCEEIVAVASSTANDSAFNAWCALIRTSQPESTDGAALFAYLQYLLIDGRSADFAS